MIRVLYRAKQNSPLEIGGDYASLSRSYLPRNWSSSWISFYRGLVTVESPWNSSMSNRRNACNVTRARPRERERSFVHIYIKKERNIFDNRKRRVSLTRILNPFHPFRITRSLMDLQHCLSTRLSETKRWRCREMERALRNARNTTSPVTNFLPVSPTRFDSRSNSLPSPPRRRNFRQCQRNRRKWSGAREEIFGCIRPVIPTAHGLFRFVDLSSFFSNRFETEERRALALAYSCVVFNCDRYIAS